MKILIIIPLILNITLLSNITLIILSYIFNLLIKWFKFKVSFFNIRGFKEEEVKYLNKYKVKYPLKEEELSKEIKYYKIKRR